LTGFEEETVFGAGVLALEVDVVVVVGLALDVAVVVVDLAVVLDFVVEDDEGDVEVVRFSVDVDFEVVLALGGVVLVGFPLVELVEPIEELDDVRLMDGLGSDVVVVLDVVFDNEEVEDIEEFEDVRLCVGAL
jgi:hypothetical protein